MIEHRVTEGLLTLAFVCCLAIATLPPSVQAAGLTVLPDPPSFRLDLPDLESRSRSLDEFSGQVVLVNFWASWCTPCLAEMPSIRRLAQAFSDQPFAVIAVNVAEGERRVATAAKRLKLDFLVLRDPDGDAFADWNGQVLPTSYLLDRSGRARYVALGPLEWDDAEVQEAVEQLLQESTGPTLAGD